MKQLIKITLIKTYLNALEKMAMYPELLGTEQEVGVLFPVGCKKGVQILIKLVRVKKGKNGKVVYGW